MTVRSMVRSCTRCPLHRTCTAPVPMSGPTPANVLVVGEAPGSSEDTQGTPFVGSAGSMMRSCLAMAGIRPGVEVAWANAVSCRPPDNRDPEPDELDACRPNLLAQTYAVDPRAIVLAGKVAVSSLRPDLARFPVSQVRSRPMLIAGTMTEPVQVAVATYHPAAALRKQSLSEAIEADLRLVRAWVRGSSTRAWDRDWDETCIACGLEAMVFDPMVVGYCKHHMGLVSPDHTFPPRPQPVQQKMEV